MLTLSDGQRAMIGDAAMRAGLDFMDLARALDALAWEGYRASSGIASLDDALWRLQSRGWRRRAAKRLVREAVTSRRQRHEVTRCAS